MPSDSGFRQRLLREDLPIVLLLILFSLPITLPALEGVHTFDSLMNLWRARQDPVGNLVSSVLIFMPPNRPAGALVNLAIYYLVGTEAVFYLFIGVSFYWINLALLYRLLRKLGAGPFPALLSTAVAGYHPAIHHVLYNFGAIYELLSLTFALLTLTFWIRYREDPSSNGFFWLCLLTFLAALNSKEIAVAIPFVLLIYQLLFSSKEERRSGQVWLRLAGFFVILIPYTLSKTIGPGAVGDDELYRLSFRFNLVDNLAWYFSEIANRKIVFAPWSALLTLACLAGLGALLRSRFLLFGLAWGLLFLGPVLPLPRTWGLFLYVPMVGFSLAVSSALVEPGRLLLARISAFSFQFRFSRLVRLMVFALLLARLSDSTSTSILRAQELHYLSYNRPYHSAVSELVRRYPTLPEGTILVFDGFPIRFPRDRWIVTFSIWLTYETSRIQVYVLPPDRNRFDNLDFDGSRNIHFLVWEDDQLEEVDQDSFFSRLREPVEETARIENQ